MSNGVTVIRRGATIALATLVVLGGFLTLLGLFSSPASAVAGTNEQINFQGRLFNAQGAVVPDGNYNIQFKIYQDGDGQSVGDTTPAGSPGTLKWTESWLNNNGQGVQVKNGYLTADLGSVNPFGSQIDWNQSTLWLSMNIGSTNATCTTFANCTPDGEMVPMKRLSSTPYAMNAGKLGGLSAAGFVQNTTTVQTANIAVQSVNSTSVTALLQGAASQNADILQVKGNGVTNPLLAVAASGGLTIRPSSDATPALKVQSSLGNNVLTVDTNNARVGVGLGGSTLPSIAGQGMEINGALRLSGGGGTGKVDNFVTPVGNTVQTKINVPLYDPGQYGQIIAMGLPSSADVTSRALSLLDARTGAHQPTLTVFSPDENQVFGLSWDGSNTEAKLKTSSSTLSLSANGINTITTKNNGGIANVGINNTASAGYALDVTGDVNTSTQYRVAGQTTLAASALTFSNAAAASIQATAGLNLGTADAANTIQLGGTSISSGTQNINIGTNTNSGGSSNVTIGSTSSSASGQTTIQSKAGTIIATNGVNRAVFDNSGALYLGTGTTSSSTGTFQIKATGSNTTGVTGSSLAIQGGSANTGNANGGNLNLSGGTGIGTGTSGLVVISTPTFSTTGNDANCYTGAALVASTCTISASTVNNSSAVIVGFTQNGQTATLPNPSLVTAGRIIYVTAANGSSDFTLAVNGGGTGNQIAMRQNTTATMIWSGTAWTAAGASSSTTLQAAYDNTLQSAGGAELVVSKTSATNGLTIRDSLTNSVNGTLLSVQTSSAAGLLSVNGNVTEYVTDAGAEVAGSSASTFPASTWSTVGSSSISRYTTAGNNINTGQASVAVNTTSAAGDGVKNQLNAALNPGMTYNVSFTTRLGSGTFTDMDVYYSVDGSATSVLCTSGQAVKTSVWTKVNCTFKAPASGIAAVNSILIRQTSGTARTLYVDNLSVTIAADYNYASDSTASDATNFATNWTSAGQGTVTVSRNTTDGNDASDSAQAAVTAGAANAGVRNKLSINPLTGTLYRISIYAKLSSGAAFNDFKVRYSRDGSTAAGGNYVDCVDYNTQTVTTSGWTQITCYITTDATAATNPYVYFVEASSAVRTYMVDSFSMTLASNTTPNVQVGGGVNGGPTTLFTLDKGASAPIASNNDALLGSMYYDTTLGKLQCYEADGWGACGSSPDNIVTISPEYTNAVMHGTGVGTMTSDICSNTLHINDGTSGQPTICGTNETYNYYKWTSPQPTAQTYGIYVTYQLPSTFKSFASGSTSLMGRTDSANSTVNYQIYRSDATGLTPCGNAVAVSSGSQTTWQVGKASGAADPSTCGFSPGNSVVFKITTTANSNANAYVGNLGFTFSNR